MSVRELATACAVIAAFVLVAALGWLAAYELASLLARALA